MPTAAQIADALLAAVNGSTPPFVVKPDGVPVQRPSEYVTLTVVRRGGGTARAGRHSTSGWAAYFMAVSQLYVDNAHNSLKRVNVALENKTLTVELDDDETVTSTPVTYASGRPVAPDDGWFSGVHVYHFTV